MEREVKEKIVRNLEWFIVSVHIFLVLLVTFISLGIFQNTFAFLLLLSLNAYLCLFYTDYAIPYIVIYSGRNKFNYLELKEIFEFYYNGKLFRRVKKHNTKEYRNIMLKHAMKVLDSKLGLDKSG